MSHVPTKLALEGPRKSHTFWLEGIRMSDSSMESGRKSERPGRIILDILLIIVQIDVQVIIDSNYNI